MAKLEPLATQVFEAAWDLGGTISGEHGCGLARTQFLRRQYGELVQVFREIKDAFDPLNVLNPGKVIGDDPHLMTRDLRRLSAAVARADRPSRSSCPSSRWTDRGPIEVAAACNGCGACRSPEPTLRMCPTFRALRTEAATPRAKANLVRQLATGAIDPRLWGAEEFKKKRRPLHPLQPLPQRMPVGRRRLEPDARGEGRLRREPRAPPRDWLFSRVELWSRLASRLPLMWNALMSQPGGPLVVRAVVRALAGSASSPGPIGRPSSAAPRGCGLNRPRPQAPGPRVLYFVDVFANYFDQELAEAVVAVLHQAGVNVYVPTAQRGSGMPALVAGDVDYARDLALANLRILGDAVRDGYTVVCSEPTAALMIRQEYLKLTDDLDAALVAENTPRPRPVPRRPATRAASSRRPGIPCGRGWGIISPATSAHSTWARPGST